MNAIGLSGGKDSTVLAFMLKEREPLGLQDEPDGRMSIIP